MTDINQNLRIVRVEKIELGASSGDHEDLTNVVAVDPRPAHPDMQPLTTLNAVNPVGFSDPHKWVKFTVQCLGNVYHAVHHNGSGNVDYYPLTVNTPALPYLKFYLRDEANGAWTVTATGAKVNKEYTVLADDRTPLTIVEILATSMTPYTPGTP